jgi:hypothetical protein
MIALPGLKNGFSPAGRVMPNREIPQSNLNVGGADRRGGFPRALIPLAALIALALLTVGNYVYFSSGMVRGDDYTERDYMNLWAGGRAVLEGLDPHDEAVWIPLRKSYGAQWEANLVAPHPLWTYILVAPLATITVPISVALWLTFSEMALLGSLYLLFVVYGKFKPGLIDFALILLGALLTRWMMLVFHNGQMSPLLLLIVTLFVILMTRGKPFWAGFALAFVALKPSPFLLFVPLIGVWLIANRRWQTITGGLGAFTALAGIALAVRPNWFGEWLAIRRVTAVTIRTPTVWGIVTDIWPDYGLLIGLILVAVMMVGLEIWFAQRRLGAADATAVALCASLAVTPYIWPYDHLLLIFPLAVVYTRLRRVSGWAANLTWLAACLALPWSLYWVATRRRVDTLSVLVPVAVGILYVATMGCKKNPATN